MKRRRKGIHGEYFSLYQGEGLYGRKKGRARGAASDGLLEVIRSRVLSSEEEGFA